MMKRWLITLGLWLARLGGWHTPTCPLPHLPPLSYDLLKRAGTLITEQEQFADRSGEAKRHQVYARLLKEYPNRSKGDLAFAIEAVLRSYGSK